MFDMEDSLCLLAKWKFIIHNVEYNWMDVVIEYGKFIWIIIAPLLVKPLYFANKFIQLNSHLCDMQS